MSFDQAPTEQDVLKKLCGHKWFILEYVANETPVQIESSIKDLYWFKFHDDETYTAMFEGDMTSGTYKYNHRKSSIKMEYEPYGSDDISIEFITDQRIELGGSIYGKDGYMILERE